MFTRFRPENVKTTITHCTIAGSAEKIFTLGNATKGRFTSSVDAQCAYRNFIFTCDRKFFLKNLDLTGNRTHATRCMNRTFWPLTFGHPRKPTTTPPPPPPPPITKPKWEKTFKTLTRTCMNGAPRFFFFFLVKNRGQGSRAVPSLLSVMEAIMHEC